MRRLTVGLLVLIVVTSRRLTAQSSMPLDAATLARDEQAFTVLATRLDSVVARFDEQRRARQQGLRVDTLAAGRVRAVVRGLPAARAVQVLRDAEAAWSSSWASAIPSFRGARLELASEGTDAAGAEWLTATLRWTTPGSGSERAGSIRIKSAAPTQRQARLDAVSMADLLLAPWKNARLAVAATPGITADTAALAQTAYADIAASPFLVGRSCLGGRLVACEQVLALRPFTPPYDDVLDAAGRASLLGSQQSYNWTVGFSDRSACIQTLDDGLCRRAFAEVTPDQVRSFYSFAGRRLLALQLLRRSAADGRLLAAGARASDADADIVLLAGDSLATYLETWRQSMLRHRPQRVLPAAATSWMALALMAAFALVGMLSSRWRAE